MSMDALVDVWDEYPAGGSELVAALILADSAAEDGSFAMPPIPKLARLLRLPETDTRTLLAGMFKAGRIRGVGDAEMFGAQRYRLDWSPATVPSFLTGE